MLGNIVNSIHYKKRQNKTCPIIHHFPATHADVAIKQPGVANTLSNFRRVT
jgi:hypothetical protein